MVLTTNPVTPYSNVTRMLRLTKGVLELSTQRIATGFKINTPKDNSSTFVNVTVARARLAGLMRVRESLGLGTATAATAVSALKSTIGLLTEMKSKVVRAQDASLSTAQLTSLQNDFAALRDQIGTIIDTAEFNGVNLLKPSEVSFLAWTSKNQDGDAEGVYSQRFDSSAAALGGETLVNTTTADKQEKPKTVALSDGTFVVTWVSNNQDGDKKGVYFQRYDANGNALGSETLVNTTTADDQDKPAVAALSSGGYIVTWESKNQDGDGKGIYAQRFDSDGNTVGNEFQVNTTTADDQKDVAVTGFSDGRFIISWTSKNQDGDAEGVYLQRYDSNGNAIGSETRVNTTTADKQEKPAITVLSDGGFVVAWMSDNQDGSGKGVYAQRYAADGSAAGSEFLVNTTTADDQDKPSVAALSNGGYVVVWESKNQDGSGKGVYSQRYDANGTAVGSETQVNTTTADDQKDARVSASAGGGYIVTWVSKNQDGSAEGVYAQRYDSNGSAIGTEFQVNTTTADKQKDAALAVLSDSRNSSKADSMTLLANLESATLSLDNQNVTLTSLNLTHVDLVNNPGGALTVIDNAISYATEKAAALGRSMRQLEIQESVSTKFIDILRESIGRLVDADIAEETAIVQANAVSTVLAGQALGIVNSTVRGVLDLFPSSLTSSRF